MNYETILVDTKNNVAVITLNRPERLNAWTNQMNRDIVAAVGVANQNPDIGAIVLTGAGRGFCAGADIKDTFAARIDGDESGAPTNNWVTFMRQSKPIIAAVNGAAVGVGVTMMLPIDVIVATDAARFGLALSSSISAWSSTFSRSSSTPSPVLADTSTASTSPPKSSTFSSSGSASAMRVRCA